MQRDAALKKLLFNSPKYRVEQIEEALFQPKIRCFQDISSIPALLRETLHRNLSWMLLTPKTLLRSRERKTFKSLLETEDKKYIESVLMKNARGTWTLCISSQVGCAMNCAFCSTGKMGFSRNLSADEILDQYRHWMYFLEDQNNISEKRITNIVFMGMGEPLANYQNVKSSINTILNCTDIGPTRIIVSTVGILSQMEKLLLDPDWPNVRLAISLHSANPEIRKKIIPSTSQDFFPRLKKWAGLFRDTEKSRRRHLTLEYILLKDANDSIEDARQLAVLCRQLPIRIKVNIIPYNKTVRTSFAQSVSEKQLAFQKTLQKNGITATIRASMGEDISAACGQLIFETEKKNKIR